MPPLIHTFKVFDNHYVFDANTNTILSLNRQQWDIARAIEDGNVYVGEAGFLEDMQKQGYFLEPDIKEIEHPETNTLEYHLTRKIRKLTLQVTQNCNLRCDYCIYSGTYETRTHNKKRMNFETAKKAIDYVLERSIETRDLNFGFYGGEPLLELSLIEKCIAYIREKSAGRKISFTVTTNGTLLTREVYERLVRNSVSITISLDGPKPVHDGARKYPNGRGSFDDIIENILNIQSEHSDAKDKISFLATANPDIPNSCVERLFSMDDILTDYNINMNFVNDQYTSNKIAYSETFNSVNTQEWAKLFLHMLGRLKKEAVSRMVLDGIGSLHNKYEKLNHRATLPRVLHPGGPCIAGTQRLFVNTDGVFYPCERVSETSEVMKIGDVYSGIDIEKAKSVINVGKTTAEQCKKCWAVLHCFMCAAFSDNLMELSMSMRLKGCAASKRDAEESFKNVCFLRTHGYDFDEVIN